MTKLGRANITTSLLLLLVIGSHMASTDWVLCCAVVVNKLPYFVLRRLVKTQEIWLTFTKRMMDSMK